MEAEGRIENLLELVAQMREYESEAEEPSLARLPRADRAGLGRRRLRPREGRDLADDGPHRQGARVPGGVHHRPRGAHLPARAQRRRRLGRRGGAPALLRRGDARAQAAATCRACAAAGCRGRSCPASPAASCASCRPTASTRSSWRGRRVPTASSERARALGRPLVEDRERGKSPVPFAAAGAARAGRRPRVADQAPGELTVEYDGDSEPGRACRWAPSCATPSFGVGEVRGWQGAGADLKVTDAFPERRA